MDDTKKVAFNLSQLMMMELHRLLQRTHNHYLNCEWTKCFHTLRCIKFNVIQNLTEDERKELKEVELKTNLRANTKGELEDLRIITETYHEIIMDFLEAHGYLVKEKEDHKRMF